MVFRGHRQGTWSHAARRRAVWLIVAAYLPSLLFLGHWELKIDIPGTDYYVGTPEWGHSHAEHEGEHEEHCHTKLNSCARVPLTTTAFVLFMAAALEAEAHEARGVPAFTALWAPHEPKAISPDPPPPRAAWLTRRSFDSSI